VEWIEYEKLEPFGDEWRAWAQVAQTIWNMNVQRDDRRTVESFMPLPPPDPDEDEEKPTQSPEAAAAAIASYGLRLRKIDDGDHHQPGS